MEKAAYAQIHNAGFPDLVDSDGRPAIELDLSKHYIYSHALEKNDPRTCNTVMFQFLAVSFNNTPVRYNKITRKELYLFTQCIYQCRKLILPSARHKLHLLSDMIISSDLTPIFSGTCSSPFNFIVLPLKRRLS